jgi:wyosine [tRNA(Phe)-imidazoG37] synthetase (radical SAM superfamily)
MPYGDDEMNTTTLAFGPVPSRRLGQSLGINNIPPKFCSYSCVYCQVGRTIQTEIEPREFFRPQDIRQAVTARVEAVRQAGERVDYLTFVPDGEPTLDVNLGVAIDSLRPLGIPVAVISNGSLLWREDVRARLGKADWVSLKVDTVDEALWRRINRPCAALSLPLMLDGMLRFAEHFGGELATETMLVAGMNDHPECVAAVADFVARLKPDMAYLAIPIRPPAESNVRSPPEETIVQAYALFKSRLANVECLTGYEGDTFPCTGDAESDLLNITAVHPMREESVRQFLMNAGLDEDFAERLVAQGKLKKVEFAGCSQTIDRRTPVPAGGHLSLQSASALPVKARCRRPRRWPWGQPPCRLAELLRGGRD